MTITDEEAKALRGELERLRRLQLSRRGVRRFALYPGYVVSANDSDRHYIPAHKLAQLFGVDLNECVVIPIRDQGWAISTGRYQGFDLSELLELRPMYIHYAQVTQAEREQYPITKEPAWSHHELVDQTQPLLTRLRRRLGL